MLWLALTVLAAGAGLLVALPFLRTSAHGETPATPVDIYAAQLQQVATDEAIGELDPVTAAELRVEIERRILDVPAAAPLAATAPFDRVTAGAVATIVVLGSAVLYAATGNPGARSAARASASAAFVGQTQTLPDVDTMIERLRVRLEETPDDAEGWRMLGWSYFETERYPQSVEAYARAVALAPANAGYQSAYGEALTLANAGAVTNQARAAFRAAVAADGRDERARHYLALAKAQAGDVRGALEDWVAALRDAPAGSQWAARMRAEAEATAQRANIDIAARLPASSAQAATGAAGLDTSVVAQAQQASPEARAQMISGMVEGLERRLAQDPRDAEGWVRLMRSRMVLGEYDRARAALQQGLTAFRDDRATQQRLRAAASELNVPGS